MEHVVDIGDRLAVGDGLNALGQKHANRQDFQIRNRLQFLRISLNGVGNDKLLDTAGCDTLNSVIGEYAMNSGTVNVLGTVFL